MLEKIAKLLNQAENAGTEAEAATFMEKAQQLATTYSVDLAKARHATQAKQRTVPEQRTIHIGEARTKGLRTLVDLYLGIASANDIKCTIAGNATRVYAVGFKEDLDISEALYASLVTQQAKAAEEFKRSGAWREEKIPVSTSGWGWQEKPQTWLTARLNFQEAYARRIRNRLLEAKMDEESRIVQTEDSADRDDSAPGAALVLVEKRTAVDEAAAPMMRRARGSYRGGTTGASSASGRRAGAAAADRARLGGSPSIGGARGSISA